MRSSPRTSGSDTRSRPRGTKMRKWGKWDSHHSVLLVVPFFCGDKLGRFMHSHYSDILNRVAEPPTWWDENGVPRYGPFTPELLPNIYSDEAVLFRIECACLRIYDVARSHTKGRLLRLFPDDHSNTSLASAIQTKMLDYGDPPNGCPVDSEGYVCAGASMSSTPRLVLQYWHRTRYSSAWIRDPSLEIDITPDWRCDELSQSS